MKTTYDKLTDASYFHLKAGKVGKTIKVEECLLVDVDIHGQALGIELLETSSEKGKQWAKNIQSGATLTSLTPRPL